MDTTFCSEYEMIKAQAEGLSLSQQFFMHNDTDEDMFAVMKEYCCQSTFESQAAPFLITTPILKSTSEKGSDSENWKDNATKIENIVLHVLQSVLTSKPLELRKIKQTRWDSGFNVESSQM